jgi:hypothetical protein
MTTPKTKMIPNQEYKYSIRDFSELTWAIVIGTLVGLAGCGTVGYLLNKSVPSTPLLAVSAIAGAGLNTKRCKRRFMRKDIVDTLIEVPFDHDESQTPKGKRFKVRKPIF